MNETNPRSSDWLAGYVDGELSPSQRVEVERLLVEQPELRTAVEGQETLSPGNTELWKNVQPPSPSAEEWDRVLKNVLASTATIGPAPAKGMRWLVGSALVATAAAILLLIAFRAPTPLPPSNNPELPEERPLVRNDANEPLVGVLQLALGDDVEIHCLPEEMASLLITGRHPLGSDLLLLAKSSEIEFHGIGADPQGRFPEVSMDPVAMAPPVIWAPNPP